MGIHRLVEYYDYLAVEYGDPSGIFHIVRKFKKTELSQATKFLKDQIKKNSFQPRVLLVEHMTKDESIVVKKKYGYRP